MIRKITLTLFSLFTVLGFSQTDIASSGLFSSGPVAWPYVFTACTVDDGNSGEAQTLEINVISLPEDGANYRVVKTTANGQFFVGNPQPLSLGLNTLTVTSVTFARTVKFQFDSGLVNFDFISLNNVTLFGENPNDGLDPCISNSDLFTSGSNESWPYIFTACTVDDGNLGEEQTLEINIISLPDGGANYRIAKTTANGQFFFGNPQPLSLGLNTLTVTSVTFARTVKFQFDNGNICFDSLELNPTSDTNEDPCISSSDLFASGSNESWPYIFTACTVDDGNLGEEQTLEINIISLPDGGANYRIAKTTANGQFFFGNPQPLSLGLNTLTVTSVTFARTVKFQFDNGNICFDSLDLNNQSVLSSTSTDIYNLSIYPNPTKSMLFIYGNEDIISIELISISGRSLMQVINTNQLDISSFSTGVYFLKVNDGTTSVVKKIIKQ